MKNRHEGFLSIPVIPDDCGEQQDSDTAVLKED